MAQIPSGNQERQSSSTLGSQAGGLDDELVRKVADQVYRLLMQEIKYDHERFGMISKKNGTRKGGR